MSVTIKRKNKQTGQEEETIYYMVKDRIKDFRKDHPTWPLITDLERMEDGNVVFKAKILNDNNDIVATGWAWESVSNGWINKYSAVENCETSAIGRALANLGYGTDGAYASYEEMLKQVDDETKTWLFELLRSSTYDADQQADIERKIQDLTIGQVEEVIQNLLANQLDDMEKPKYGQKEIKEKLRKIKEQ